MYMHCVNKIKYKVSLVFAQILEKIFINLRILNIICDIVIQDYIFNTKTYQEINIIVTYV